MDKTVLMIEDNENNALLVRRVLEASQAFNVVHAEDGERGLQMAMETNPDIILLDLGLPDVDGQTLASFIKRMPDLESVPLIALTAWPEDTARDMAKAYGCDGYIAKPINTRTFADEVRAYL